MNTPSTIPPWEKMYPGSETPVHQVYLEQNLQKLQEHQKTIDTLRAFIEKHKAILRTLRWNVKAWGDPVIEIYHGLDSIRSTGVLGVTVVDELTPDWPTPQQIVRLWPGEWRKEKEKYSSNRDLSLNYLTIVDGVTICIRDAELATPIPLYEGTFTV